LENQYSDITLLLEGCAANNEKAQLTVYNKYYKAMFNVSYRIVNDSALAEDIMQESFLKAFSKLDSFSGAGTFGSWLKKIVINYSINELKKSTKYRMEALNENTEVEDDYEEESASYTNLKAEKVLETIQSLKSNYKIILTLFFIEGYDLEEITSILNISNENCRTMMSRAKESLRKKLTQYE